MEQVRACSRCVNPCVQRFVHQSIEHAISGLGDCNCPSPSPSGDALPYLQMQSRNKPSATLSEGDSIAFDTMIANDVGSTIEYVNATRHFVLQPGIYQVLWTVVLHDASTTIIQLIVDGLPYTPSIRATKTVSSNDIVIAGGSGAIISLDVTETKGQSGKLSAGELQSNILIVKIG